MFSPLPPNTVLRWSRGDLRADLPRVERAAIRGASETRRREFATTRTLARHALRAAGGPATALPPAPSRAPTWPEGWTGSLTHCHGLRAALVGPTAAVAALGIDAEPLSRPDDRVCDAIVGRAERHRLAPLGAWGPITAFSAKEALFKAWHPLTARWLDLLDATVTRVEWHPDRQRGRLVLGIAAPGAAGWPGGPAVDVWCRWREGRVHALVAIEAEQPARRAVP